MKRLFLLLLFSAICFAQLDTLQKIKIDQVNFTDFERSFVFQNGDSLYYFYRQQGSTKVGVALSEDAGQTWIDLYEINDLLFPNPNVRSFDIIQTGDTEFIFGYVNFVSNIQLFNYNIADNSLEQIGNYHESSSGSHDIELIQIDSSTFITSIKDNQNNVFYYKTTDSAQTWSEKLTIPDFIKGDKAVSMIYHDGLLLAVQSDGNNIKITSSTDQGESWNTSSVIYSNDVNVPSAFICSNNSDLFITFEEENHVELIDDYQSDICYIKSSDNATNWSPKINYTEFIGTDLISEICYSSGSLIAVSLSNRTYYDRLNSYFGYLQTTEDPAPPIIYSTEMPNYLTFDENFVLRLFVNDETGIGSVFAEFDNIQYELLDDGNHNDSLANDNIYGITINGYASTNQISQTVIKVNNITMPLNNRGILADVNPVTYQDLAINVNDIDDNTTELIEEKTIYSGEGSLGRYNGIGFLFSGGFFLSGYKDSELWANAVASSALVEDYLPGNIESSPDNPGNVVYSVSTDDTPFGITWQNWRDAVEQGAYFYDGDGDGIYDPVDKNSNGIWDTDEDKPDLLYDASYFTVYNDKRPAGQRRWNTVDPLGIEIRQTVFASERNSILDDVLFVRYSLLYKGLGDPSEPDTLKNVIYSIWNDADIGEAVDDLVGCDTTLQAGYTYNDGEDDTWDTKVPPAVFNVIVQGPLVKTGNPDDYGYNRMGPDLGEEAFEGYYNGKMNAFVNHIGGDPRLIDPDNKVAARNYMLGQTEDGSFPDPCNWTYGDVFGGVDCAIVDPRFWYSGDPVANIGWIETSPQDHRTLMSTEMFNLIKDEPMDIIVAYVVGQGTDALNSITRTREITQYVHEEYERNFSTIVGVNDKTDEVVNKYSLSQNYPNPFNPTSKIKYQIAKLGKVELKVYDILGREVITLVNEVKSPGNYEVTFNASQLASGVYFYRLTVGDFVQTKKMILLR